MLVRDRLPVIFQVKHLVLIAILVFPCFLGCSSDPPDRSVNGSIHTFYYGWYGNLETDGGLRHWNHDVLGVEDSVPYPGGEDIGANYFPELGNYSSNDERIVRQHLRQCADAGIGVVVASWWGADSFEDNSLSLLMDTAAAFGIGIAFHLEPFPDRGAQSSRDALVYLLDRYGDHPGLFRSPQHESRPVVYIYDSYLTSAQQWSRLLHPDGDLTLRGTVHDIVAIGLWVNQDEGAFFLEGGFDGFYTYFASDGFTYGSSSIHWQELSTWARKNDLTFIPCVGPGYLDTRVRPWNSATTRSREEGAYFDRMFQRAIEVHPPLIGITSFNEWHEGTQIEPAVPNSLKDYTYEDYAPLGPGYYLERTRYWVEKFSRMKK